MLSAAAHSHSTRTDAIHATIDMVTRAQYNEAKDLCPDNNTDKAKKACKKFKVYMCHVYEDGTYDEIKTVQMRPIDVVALVEGMKHEPKK